MKTKRFTGTFWAVLAAVNVLALLYPITTFMGSNSEGAQFLSAIVVMTVVFMLGIIDVIAITIAYCRDEMGF